MFFVCLLVVAACGDEELQPPPDTLIDSQPDELTNETVAMFQFRPVGAANGFFCTVDSGDPITCVPPFVVENIADGMHTFSVAAALNAAVDDTPATATWRVDTTEPVTRLLSGPPELDNDPTPTFTFEGEDAEGAVTFECTVDGNLISPCASGVTLEGLADATHVFNLIAVDAAGNRDSTPETLTWTLTTALPETQITVGPATASTTAGNNVVFEFTSPDTSATFECRLDSPDFVACVSPVELDGLSNGPHAFVVRAVATAGADPSPDGREWSVDAIAPTTTFTLTPTDPSSDGTPDFTFTASEASTFQCSVDGGTFNACTSPFQPALADGPHQVRVRAFDAVGNQGAEAAFAWTIDTLAPTVAFDAQPAALSSDNSPTVAFTVTGAPTSVACSIDGGVPFACSSPQTFNGVADGSHTISVTVTDAAANSSTATTGAFAIDTISPTATFTAVPLALSSNNDPSVSFTVTDAPTTILCQLDASVPVACTSPHQFADVPDGSHTITVLVSDGAGNATSVTTASFAIDTDSPTVTITTEPLALSNDNSPTVVFTAGGGSSITCRLDTGTPVTCSSPHTFTNVVDGNHTITVTVSDGANSASDTTDTFAIDTDAPTVTITTQPLASSNDNSPTVAFTATGQSSTTCQLDTDAPVACTSPHTFLAVGDGGHTITVRVADAAGNSDSETTGTFTIDTGAPGVTITTEPLALSSDTSPTVVFNVSGATTVRCQLDAGAPVDCTSPHTLLGVGDGSHTITVTASDGINTASDTTAPFAVDTEPPTLALTEQPLALSSDNSPTVAFTAAGQTTTTCQLDAATPVSCTSPHTFTNVADGNHTITVRVVDGAGNATSVTTSPFTIDTGAPVVTITTEPLALSNDTSPSVVFTVTGGATSVTCQLDAATPVACSSPHTFLAVGDGSHTITVRAFDNASNVGSDTTAPFTIDTLANVTITGQPAALSNDNTPAVTFDAVGATTITCRIDNTAPVPCSSPHTFGVTADGNHTITVRVADDAGNSESETTAPFAIDTVATVTITGQPAVLSNDNSPTVNFTTTGATTSRCQLDGNTPITCTAPSHTFTSVADGPHVIRVLVNDTAGNASLATTDIFVIDTDPPVTTITSEPLALSNDNSPTVAFTVTGATTITCQLDNTPAVDCTSPHTFTNVADGNHRITVRGRDDAGNVTPAQTGVFAIDTVATVAITTEPLALSNDNSPTVAFTAVGATTIQCQLDAGAPVTCTSPHTFTNVPDGAHTITVLVSDTAGNAASDTTNNFTIDTVATVTINTQPVALSNDNSPTVTFTAVGATTIQCRLDAGTPVACTSPHTFTSVPDGAHTITVLVSDAAGNSDSETTTSFTIDTVATVTITTEPLALSNDNSPTVAFTAVGATTVQCRLDAGTPVACTSPHTFTSVGDGAHTISVSVSDGAGNSAADATGIFVIDTVATVTITTEPAASSDDDSPTVAFTAVGATTIQCRLDAGTPVTCTSPHTFTNVADGDHTITVSVSDAAGNSDSDTTSTFTIDTVPLTVEITSEPAALSNDNNPAVAFTVTGATAVSCQLDAGPAITCTSPHAFTNVPDGDHTITVIASDGADTVNASTATFTIDTSTPTVTIIDSPPLSWPVNYYDMLFTADEPVTFECSLDGAAFVACSGGSFAMRNSTYSQEKSFAVRATDGAGNVDVDEVFWSSEPGLVVHYPWEQGDGRNTSLLSQVSIHSPDGPGGLPFVGGWAGSSLDDVPPHIYPNTANALTSSPLEYTVSFWIRPSAQGAFGTLMSTIAPDLLGGFEVRIEGPVLTTRVAHNATIATFTTTVQPDRWTHVGLRATGPAKPLEVFVDGQRVGQVNSPSTGFEPTQAKDLTVGPLLNVSLDDLRFHNEAFTVADMCLVAARGSIDQAGLCVPLAPMLELDFEGTNGDPAAMVDTGTMPPTVTFTPPTAFNRAFLNTGDGARITNPGLFGYRGFANATPRTLPGRTWTLWFSPFFGNAGTLLDFTTACPADDNFSCGIQVEFDGDERVTITAGTNGDGILPIQDSIDITLDNLLPIASIVITEQRNGAATERLSVFVNGDLDPHVLLLGIGDVYEHVNNGITLGGVGSTVDEYEFWPADLSKDPEVLCENGFDGTFDHVEGTCLLTANEEPINP